MSLPVWELRPAEAQLLERAVGLAATDAVRQSVAPALRDYAEAHGAMTVIEAAEHARSIMTALGAAATALREAPAELADRGYWWRGLEGELDYATTRLSDLIAGVPTHRAKDRPRLHVLAALGRALVAEGISITEAEKGRAAAAVRVYLAVMDRVANRRYRGSRPRHGFVRGHIRTMKGALRRRGPKNPDRGK